MSIPQQDANRMEAMKSTMALEKRVLLVSMEAWMISDKILDKLIS
jgi:hypothetical protein